jgi:hypothetical protein
MLDLAPSQVHPDARNTAWTPKCHGLATHRSSLRCFSRGRFQAGRTTFQPATTQIRAASNREMTMQFKGICNERSTAWPFLNLSLLTVSRTNGLPN